MSIENTIDLVEDWVEEESDILETLRRKEIELVETYGEGEYYCPYYAALFQLFEANMHKGWTKDELIRDLEGVFSHHPNEQTKH